MKTLFLFCFLILLISCSEPQPRFIDIDKANAEILRQTGIDILAFRAKIEKDFDVDEDFYDSLLFETSEKNTNELFRKYGYYSVKTNGDTITSDVLDSIYLHFVNGLALGIIQENCSSSDSLCIAKMEFYESMTQAIPPYGRVDNEIPYYFYSKFYQKGYLTQAEMSFMSLWWYILSSAQGISDLEWHIELLKKKKNP